jgi:peptide deformylase
LLKVNGAGLAARQAGILLDLIIVPENDLSMSPYTTTVIILYDI